MGAGHDGVSRELALRLSARGFDCHIMDMVQVLPWRTGKLLRGFYSSIIRWTPWLYEFIYRVWLEPDREKGATMSPVTRALERRISAWVDANHPAVIVSTFAVTTQTVGDMRSRGELQVPVVNVIVDFAAHGAWVNSGIDLHIVLHSSSGEQVEELLIARESRVVRPGETPAVPRSRVAVTGPTVREEFRDGRWDPPDARTSLGVSTSDPLILIVGGSWGAGGVLGTVRTVLSTGHFVPLVVCGNNPSLRRKAARLCRRAGRGVVVGWVDDMWRYMAAADVLVENAGGLTAMEATACELPVVSFRPIPGHGVRDVMAMEKAEVSTYARSERDLRIALDTLVKHGAEWEHQVNAAAAMFRGDAADEIVTVAEGSTSL